jgi:p-aminobenzoyl-glutamate transporter AbgT
MPSNWVSRPLAGASALFGLVLTVYQGYLASTLLGSNLSNLGTYSLAVFAVFSLVYVYLELSMLSLGRAAESTQKP